MSASLILQTPHGAASLRAQPSAAAGAGASASDGRASAAQTAAIWRWIAAVLVALGAAVLMVRPAMAQAVGPDELIRKISVEVLDAVKADTAIQAGDVSRVNALVDQKVMPHVNFQRMTASAVGRFWRQATPEQQARLQAEFKTLLVRTYSGALAQVRDQTVELRPFRANAGDTEVLVRTLIRGRGEPIQLDYRLEKAGDTWRIFDVNVLGVWLVQSYQTQFAQEISAGGIDGLIARLAERNKAAARS